MRTAWNRWAVALRIARRSALTSWGRSLLIVVLIAVPIIGLTAGAVVLPSLQSTLDERIQGTLGHAQAKLTVVDNVGRGVEQGREGGFDYTESKPDGKDVSAIDPRTLLPSGTRTIAVTGGAATFATPKGETSLRTVTGETWDPSLDGGPFELLSGHRPTAADEVLLSPAALSRLGALVGGTIEMRQPIARTLRVVGTSRDRSLPTSTQSVFGDASLLPADSVPDTFYVPTTRIDWPLIEKLNAEAGTTVFSRTAVLQPSAYAQRFDGTGSSFWDLNFGTSLVVAMALAFAVLEVALLAGSAFLVGARLQQRSLATVASVGADRSVLRRIVTANGVVLGAVGGVAGVGVGILGAVVFMRLTDDGAWTRYPGLHLWWPLLAGIAVFGVVVGWTAALVPARAASRFDVVRALRGARTPQKVGRRPVAGVVLLLVGVVLTLLGGVALVAAQKLSGPSGTVPQIGAAALLCGGPVLAQLGVLLCSGLVLRGVASSLRRAPLAARLAARDTSRNLGRAVPAVASVMTTVFIAAFVMCIANSASIMGAITYYWTLAKPGAAVSYISSDDPTSSTADRWGAVLRQDLPVDRLQVIGRTLQGTDDPTPSGRHRDALAIVRTEDSICPNEPSFSASDTRCGPYSATGGISYSSQYPLVVGDEEALALLLGHAPTGGAATALRNGGVVALRTGLVHDGEVRLDWFTPKQLAAGVESADPVRSKSIPAVVDLPVHAVQDALFVTTATARSLQLTARPDRVLLDFTRPPTDSELDTANTAVAALANDPSLNRAVYVETGPQDYGAQIAWLILLACLVIAICAGATAIALARVDARADDLTLASLGASPRVRKSVAFVQALVICGVGAVIGTALGLLPAVAVGIAARSLPFAPPVLQLALTAVGIPIVIAAGSWLLVGRRRGDLTRRTAIA